MPGQGLGHGTPLCLELERPGPGRGAAQVETAEAQGKAVADGFPIHEVVGAQGVVVADGRGPGDFQGVAVPVEKAGRGGFCVQADEHDARLLGQPGQHVGKKAFGIDRRAQVAHVAHEDRVEIIQQLLPAPHDFKPRALGLAHLVADLDAHASPHAVLTSVQRQDHGHLVPLGRQGQIGLARVPQFHMPRAKAGTQILGGLQQGLG